MSTSAYYNYITTTDKSNATASVAANHEARRQTAVSPASLVTSSSDSSSSLYHCSSLTPTSEASSSSSPSSSSSSSSVASSLLCNQSSRNLLSQVSVADHQQQHHHNGSQLLHSYTLHSLEPKPLKPYRTKSDYLEAMKEDLAEWLNRLYPDLTLTPDNFFAQLETGAIICRHANNVTKMGRESSNRTPTPTSSPPPTTTTTSYDNKTLNNEPNNNLSLSPKQSASLSPSQQFLSLNTSTNLRHECHINWFRVKILPFKQDARPGTFFARDNICQFILWCRSLNILECLLFETDDLVARKNEKSFILCLLEVARIGFKVGMPTPLIIQLEQEIDREIENDAKLQKELEEKQMQDSSTIGCYDYDVDDDDDNDDDCDDSGRGLNEAENQISSKSEDLQEKQVAALESNVKEDCQQNQEEDEEDYGPKPQVITNDLLSLHEKVVQLLCLCTCPTQFPMVRVGDNGKYKVGDKLIIFVRILRRHIMVRVGGGWQELSEFLRVKDPCRSRLNQQAHSTQHNISNHHYSTRHNQSARLTPSNNSVVTKSRLLDSSQLVNKGHTHHRSSGGQRLISGSASMSWLSNNS